jgi:hypothetical protein
MRPPFDKERLARIEAIFHDALEVAVEQRVAFVSDRCGTDANLVAEVMALLDAARDTDDMMERSAAESIRGLGHQKDGLPERIGPFQIVGLLGEGGMGSVYEALQESPRRRVALKVVHGSAWSRTVQKRFEHEIEILGQLQHPGIARLYQAGTVKTGGVSNAYFAMELIAGESLTRYVRNRSMPLGERLELLARVCDAVHHAHQRGIIHRDIKPANILVEPPKDAEERIGQPKILDFGIARDASADGSTIMTRAGEFIGTLGYMSPEQAEAKPLDTRSDVYALGVVCFEVLGGKLPIDVTSRPLTEAVTMMRDASPTRLGTLFTELRGDVETVVHKALEREPSRRYQSASELAADLRRIIRNEPILARPASGLYHLRKFAGRNRLLVAAAMAVLVALSAGLATSTYQYFKAVKARQGEALQTQMAQERLKEAIAQRERADREAELTAAVQQYLVGDLLVAASPSRLGINAKLVDVLDDASAQLAERFPDRPEVQAEIRTRLAEVYAELGQYKQSINQARQAMGLFERQGMRKSERWVIAATGLCSGLRRTARLAEALELATEVKDIAEEVLPADSLHKYRAMQSFAESLQRAGRFREAEAIIEEYLPLVESREQISNAILGSMLSTLGACYAAENRLEDFVRVARRSYEWDLKRSGPDNASTLAGLNNLLNALIRSRHFAEAAALATDLPARAERVFPAGHQARMFLTLTAAKAFRSHGHLQEALPCAIRAYEFACAAFDPFRWETEGCVSEVRFLLRQMRDQSEQPWLWGRRAVHIRLVAAGLSEVESLLKCIQEVSVECAGAGPSISMDAGTVVEFMWDEVQERAPVGDGRRARYCANLARIAASVGKVDIARAAIVSAEEAMKDSPRQEEDREILRAARQEVGVE